MARLKYRARGFTLLEVLIVTILIALIAGVTVPRFFGSIDKAEIRKNAGEIAAFMKSARRKAVAEKKVVTVVLDSETGEIFAVLGRYDRSNKQDRIAPKNISENVRLWTGGKKILTIEFNPSGTAAGGKIYVTGAEGQSPFNEDALLVSINPLSGKIIVTAVNDKDEKW
ncbi:MAG: hypothetical protein IEMM0002_1362 [bacterium]|nr:MAG: hypothetical protein IEMM0002_1362 [bacterium]